MTTRYRLIEHELSTEPLPKDFDVAGLRQYLDEVWQSRFVFDEGEIEEGRSIQQPFLRFEFGDQNSGAYLRAGKHVGFIQYENITIEILPKLFQKEEADEAFRHLLWWLHYCQKIRFPFTDILSDSDSLDDFPEALIGYFARYTYHLVSTQPYQHYEECTEAMTFLRGSLNTQAYIRDSVSRGYWHEFVCDYSPFVFNNRLNQIIKYVARRLTYLCRLPDTHRWLEKVLFMLDEVEDVFCTITDCNTIHFNRFFHEYETCLDMCRFLLSDSYLNRQEAHERHFCFLLPMDYVFENFIAGIAQLHLHQEFKVKSQSTDWLTDQRVFQIRNDLLLTHKKSSRKLIVDTKYKLRDQENKDSKQGISQTDLYQMISYALRRETDQVVLLYPCRLGQSRTDAAPFTVSSGVLSQPINIRAIDIPITGATREEIEARVVHFLKEALVLMPISINGTTDQSLIEYS
jgi:5-methylcytosine-specific restriction enzyme subunit McrC